ncbi:MAG: hypothetical protein KDB29_03300 [Planctomycetes bacterium]|nr:hypothetical protein [Planctomycetota bacterium]
MSVQNPTRRETLVRALLLGGIGSIVVIYFIVAVFRPPLQADNFTNSFSTSPGGHSALVELLRANKREVSVVNQRLSPPADDGRRTETLALLEPGAEYVEHYSAEFETLFARSREEYTSVMLVLPKRHYRAGEPAEDDPEASEGEVLLWEEIVPIGSVREIWERTGFDRWLEFGRTDSNGTLSWNTSAGETELDVELEEPAQYFSWRETERDIPDEFEVLLVNENGDPVAVRYVPDYWQDTGGVLLVADGDIFTNRFITKPGAATMLMRLFEYTPKDGPILIDEDLHGFSTDASFEYLAATPPGLWLTLSVFMLLGVFGWRQATVLRPLSAEPQDRQARKFSIDGLARMMERARDHHTAYRRLVKRSRLVLGSGGVQVQGAGMAAGTSVIQKGKTGRVTRIQGGTDEERLINAARKIAHQVRTGETEHGDWSED